jgi:Flp pilus assembly protein TadB
MHAVGVRAVRRGQGGSHVGLLLVVLGIVIWLLVSPLIGLILVLIGIVLLFVPGVPYGYGYYRGRRGP